MSDERYEQILELDDEIDEGLITILATVVRRLQRDVVPRVVERPVPVLIHEPDYDAGGFYRASTARGESAASTTHHVQQAARPGGEMRRTFLVVAVAVMAALTLGIGGAGANVPGGKGLVSFGTFQCGGLGDVEVLGPRPPQVPAGFTSSGEKFVMLSLSVVFTDPSGNASTVSKTWGAKTGLHTVTCTQHFEDPGEGSGDATAVIALVPPH